MIRFEDVVQKIVIEHGIASDRLNKELVEAMLNAYFTGFKDCDTAVAVGKKYSLDEVKKNIFKYKESYEV